MAVIFKAFPREEFRQLVFKLLGSDMPVIWEGNAEPFIGPKRGRPGSICKIDVKRVEKLGLDETRYAWDSAAASGTGANAVYIGGQRVYHLLIRVNSFSFDIPGYDPLEDLRLKFLFQSTQDALTGMGLAFLNAGDVIPIDYNTDNRPAFAAVCEYRFGFAVEQEITDDSGGIIAEVDGGDVSGAGTLSN